MAQLNVASSIGIIALASLGAAACLEGGETGQPSNGGSDGEALRGDEESRSGETSTDETGTGATGSSTDPVEMEPDDDPRVDEPRATGGGSGTEESDSNFGGSSSVDETSPCDDQECGDGICFEREDTTYCDCPPHVTGASCDACSAGYSGEDCHECAEGYIDDGEGGCVEDRCEEIRCVNGSTCIQMGQREPYCECPVQFTGDNCLGCAEGYEGENCEDCAEGYVREGRTECRPETCRDVDCGDNGMCVHEEGEAVCDCDEGYQGDFCDACVPGWTMFEGESTQRPPSTDAHLFAWFDASKVGSLDLNEDNLISEWRDLASDNPRRIWPTHPNENLWSRYSPETDGVVYDGDDGASYSGLMGSSEHFSVYFVMRWNEGAGGQTIWQSYDPDDKFVSSRFHIDNDEVFLSWVGPNEFDEPDVLSAQLWEDKGPVKLVAFKRVPFLDGTAFVISNGADQVVSMANNGPLEEAQAVQLGYGWQDEDAEYLRGTFHEIVMFDGALSSEEEGQLVEYLDVKWGL